MSFTRVSARARSGARRILHLYATVIWMVDRFRWTGCSCLRDFVIWISAQVQIFCRNLSLGGSVRPPSCDGFNSRPPLQFQTQRASLTNSWQGSTRARLTQMARVCSGRGFGSAMALSLQQIILKGRRPERISVTVCFHANVDEHVRRVLTAVIFKAKIDCVHFWW